MGIIHQLAEKIFEELEEEEAKKFRQTYHSLPAETDLKVWSGFVVWLLEEFEQFCSPEALPFSVAVRSIYVRQLGGDTIDKNEWEAAIAGCDGLAYAACPLYAASAGYAISEGDLDEAASDAADTAGFAADTYGFVVAESSDENELDAEGRFYGKMKDKLIELLRG